MLNSDLCSIVLSYLPKYREIVKLLELIEADKVKEIHDWEVLNLRYFNGEAGSVGGSPLSPLHGAPLQTLYLNWFTGDLSPLRGAPLQELHLDRFNGDLSPLRGAPIQKLYLFSFNGDLSPLRGAPLQMLDLWSFKGESGSAGGDSATLSPLYGAPIQTLNLWSFNGDLSPLRGAPLRTLYLFSFTGDTSILVELEKKEQGYIDNKMILLKRV